MLKPLEYIEQFERERRERDKINLDSFYTYTDSLITWIIGFCITSLSLIVSNYSGILTNLHGSPKPIVLLLLISILLGLSYRMLAYSMLMFDRQLDSYLIGVYGKENMVPIEADEDVDTWIIDFVIKKLKSDFDVDVTVNVNPAMTEMERLRLIKSYKEWCEYYRREYNIAMENVIEVNEVIYKIPKQKLRKLMEKEKLKPSMGYNAILWARLINSFYWLTVLSFATAVIWVSIFLLNQ